MTEETTDDVKWLRDLAKGDKYHHCAEGLERIADRLEQLVAENDRLREALRQYANDGNWNTKDENGPLVIWDDATGNDGPVLARTALGKEG